LLFFLIIFFISFFISFFVSNTAVSVALISTLSSSLLSLSEKNLLYSSLFSWMGSVMCSAYSPRNGLLLETLEINDMKYTSFIKRIWKQLLFIFFIILIWIIFWVKFFII
jgi:uncharacterized ion transporter superfamily protein YfcC